MNATMKLIHSILIAVAVLATPVMFAQDAKTVVDYHTTVERLFNLEKGMSMTEVNQALNSEPHDLLQNTKGGYLMLEYRYLKAYRKVKASEVDTESGRILGTPQYREAASAYLMFDNGHRLVSWVTADAMGDIRHQYMLEATARRLGALDAPCTRNCRIAIPVDEAAGEAVEEEPKVDQEPEAKDSPVSNLFGGLRNKLETMTNSVTSLDGSGEVGDADVRYETGDEVWININGERIKGVVSAVSSGSVEVRFTDSESNMREDYFRLDDVSPRD